MYQSLVSNGPLLYVMHGHKSNMMKHVSKVLDLKISSSSLYGLFTEGNEFDFKPNIPPIGMICYRGDFPYYGFYTTLGTGFRLASLAVELLNDPDYLKQTKEARFQNKHFQSHLFEHICMYAGITMVKV